MGPISKADLMSRRPVKRIRLIKKVSVSYAETDNLFDCKNTTVKLSLSFLLELIQIHCKVFPVVIM